MYYYIKGMLVHKTENFVVIDANGVGYKILTSHQSLSHHSLNSNEKANNEVLFYTYLYVREDIHELFGFSTPEELSSFELLISVSGVGPKAAINILSSLSAPSLALAIVTNDVKSITKAQGIGPKLAQRLILELKDKIKNEHLIENSTSIDLPYDDSSNEALSALIVLGYSAQEAKKALSQANASELPVEEAIKKALTYLMR